MGPACRGANEVVADIIFRVRAGTFAGLGGWG